MMKKIAILLVCLLAAVATYAQTPEEILSRMEEVMSQSDTDGLVMTMDIKIPLLGTMSTKSYSLGNKMRLEMSEAGAKVITWSDGKTSWTYNDKKNEVEITNDKEGSSSDNNDAEMLTGIADGYDVSIKKETDEAWYIQCKKSKDNKIKDDPKSMDLVVAKGTYSPISLSAKMSGIKVTMRDFSFQVTEEQVTFNPADYPNATFIDKRN